IAPAVLYQGPLQIKEIRMNNAQSAQTLRRRIALFLLVSTINFIASPFFAGSSTRVKAAPLFDGPTDFIRRIPLLTNDLVYSNTTGKIYATFPSSVGSNGNSIAAIDPMTGVVSNTTFVGSEPTKLALSDDGHSIYVWLNGSFMFRRFDALTNTPGLQFSMGQEPTSGRYVFRDFAVAPANPSVLAVARGIFNVGSPQGVAIFDDGVRRTNIGPIGSTDSIAFSASASKLYGTGPSTGLQTMTVDGSGVSVSSTSSLGQGTRIQFSNGLIYTSSGQVINPDTNTLLGTFPVGFSSHAFTIDSSVSRAYYLINDFGTFTLKAFDLNTFALVGSLTISNVSFFPGATPLLRWGANGLALRTDNELILIQTSLIPSAEPIPTPTPTPTSSPTPSPSPSPGVPAFVRQITLTTNDLVFSQATQKFYASVPSSEGSTGNSVAEIDPVSATVT